MATNEKRRESGDSFIQKSEWRAVAGIWEENWQMSYTRNYSSVRYYQILELSRTPTRLKRVLRERGECVRMLRAGVRYLLNPLLFPKYKWFVGPPEHHDRLGRLQAALLRKWGLRPEDSLLDVGCGSLRGGRYLIPYLQEGHYFAIEPEVWLLATAIKKESLAEVVQLKRPVFSFDSGFNLSVFGRKFDYLLAGSILSHASPQEVGKLLAEARKVMCSNSYFFATFHQGEEDYAGESWVYPGVVSYRHRTIANWAAEHGLGCSTVPWPNPGLTWVVFHDPSDAVVGERLAAIRGEREGAAGCALEWSAVADRILSAD